MVWLSDILGGTYVCRISKLFRYTEISGFEEEMQWEFCLCRDMFGEMEEEQRGTKMSMNPQNSHEECMGCCGRDRKH